MILDGIMNLLLGVSIILLTILSPSKDNSLNIELDIVGVAFIILYIVIQVSKYYERKWQEEVDRYKRYMQLNKYIRRKEYDENNQSKLN